MATRQSISLLDLDPDNGRLLSAEERASAAAVRLPVCTIGDAGVSIDVQLESSRAFGALVIDGLVIQQVRIGQRTAISLLGPGDVIAHELGSLPPPLILSDSRRVTGGPVRLALLGSRTLLALGHWPQLTVGLYGRLTQQADRLAAQLLVCQLPRVEDRVLGLMWLLAEPWGKVTGAGTRLPLVLTHEAIGTMVGAQRPTISLALRELTERGALLRQKDGWLLLEPPPGYADGSENGTEANGEHGALGISSAPELRPRVPSAWSVAWQDHPHHAEPEVDHAYLALREAVGRLRQQHSDSVARFEQRMKSLRKTRERCQQTRREMVEGRISRQKPTAS